MLGFAAYASEVASTAGAAPAAAGGSLLGFMTPLLVIFLIFYFFLLRPQNKRLQEYQKLMASLRRGDRVVTTGGIIGTITKVDDGAAEVMVEIADGVRIRVQRNAIAEVLAKTGAVAEVSADPVKKSS